MILSAIVAVSENGVIGKEGTLPWKLKDDLKWFQKNTTGHCIITGRKNFDDIGVALPKRHTLLLTRQPNLEVDFKGRGQIIHTPGEAQAAARNQGDEEPFVIGGAEIYKIFMPQVKRLYLTRVHAVIDGDVFLPDIGEGWKEVFSEHHKADDRNEFDYTFQILER